MTKIEQLKAAYDAARGGKWSAPGHYEVVNDADELVCNDVASTPTAEFIALAHNMMPQLLLAVAWLKETVLVLTTPEDLDEDARRATRRHAGLFLEELEKLEDPVSTEVQIERAYFASESSGSMQHENDLAAGYVAPGEVYYQLQRNDGLGSIASDEDAVRQCVKEAAGGDPYAAEQLRLAQTDGLVRRIQEEMA